MKLKPTLLLILIPVFLLADCDTPLRANYGEQILKNRTLRKASSKGASDVSDWPDPQEIAVDLVGHSLSEGVENGYHPADWRFTVEYGNVSDFRITDVLVCNNDKYQVVATMNLSKGGSYYYHTTARINYVKSSNGKPVLDYVLSLGMTVVSDGEYDSFISANISEDGWGGTYCLRLRNKGELSLIVGGKFRTSHGWQNFSSRVEPYGESTVGGLFHNGSVEQYVIEFVVRP